jgi:hypothetical protein
MWKADLNIPVTVCLFMIILTGPAAAATNYVSSGESIQAAIDDANDGDEIEVAPGTYNEAINFNDRAVRLYSRGGPDVTTIDANGAYHVVQCVSGEDANTILEGFTITGGNANGPDSNDRRGGGMYNSSASPTVVNCIFIGNTASSFGGGMANDKGSSPTVTNCTFTGNTAGEFSGGMDNELSSPVVTNCTFSGNYSFYGGGMGNYEDSNTTVTNCTFSSNSANPYGGGRDNSQSSPTVTNCIFWSNEPDEIFDDPKSSSTVSYCDVQGGWLGEGNIDADPCFVQLGYWADANDPNIIVEPNDPNAIRMDGNYRLRPDSPCVDAGDNNSVPADTTDLDYDGDANEPIPVDFGGLPRFIDDLCRADTGNPGSLGPPVVDMGTYEYLAADIDSSGAVVLRDLCMFALHWAEIGCGRCGGADLNCDGNVDWNDLRELTDWWLAGTEPEL